MKIGDCYIRPAMGGRSRSIWRITDIEGTSCRADLYDFGDQGIYRYKGEPFSVKRFSMFIPVDETRFELVGRLFDNAVRNVEDIIEKSSKWKSGDLEFGTCLYSEEDDYKGVMKLIEQSGENSLHGEYLHVSARQFSRETIRPGIVSLSQYEEDESKMCIDSDVFDKILKVFSMTYATIQATVDRAVQEYRKETAGKGV